MTDTDLLEDRATGLDLDTRLPRQFSLVANRFTRTLERMYAERFDLTVTGWRILALLGERAPMASKDVASAIAMDAVGVSRAIDQLVGLGLVLRRADPKDRRRLSLRLSGRGRMVYAEIVPVALAIERALLDALEPDDRAALRRIMRIVAGKTETILAEDRDWRDFVD